MNKRVNHSATTLFRLLNLLTTRTILLFIFSRTYARNIVETTIEQDGSICKLSEFETYENLDALFNASPKIQLGELIDQTICNMKIPAPQSIKKLNTKHGFFMSVPIPGPVLTGLIEKIPVAILGQVDPDLTGEHVVMLKKILPAVTNHQLLAHALANPRFKFVICYNKVLEKEADSISAQGATKPETFTVLLDEKIFEDEVILLNVLRNEFATVNTLIANDCRLGTYDQKILRGVAFIFYPTAENARLGFNAGKKNKVNQAIKDIFSQYDVLFSEQDKYVNMRMGKIKKTSKYKKLEAHLAAWAPSPNYLTLTNKFINENYVPEESQVDKNLLIYYFKPEKFNKEAAQYIFSNSLRSESDTTSFYMYPYSPYTLEGKLDLLYYTLSKDKELALSSENTAYAGHHQIERFSEWLSFLEGALSPSFLQFLFPAYCDYMTEYTKLDQDNRNYCAP